MKIMYLLCTLLLLSFPLRSMEEQNMFASVFPLSPYTPVALYQDGQPSVIPVYQVAPSVTQQPSVPFDVIINRINNAIDKKYAGSSFLTKTLNSWQLSEKDMFIIIKTIDECYPQLSVTDEIINALYEKNTFFAKAIDHFTQRASDNFTNVTSSTLDVATNATAEQRMVCLNTLRLVIKKYVINKAFNQIEHQYEMTLKAAKDTIECFDISPIGQLAVAASFDNSVYLWDLQTTKLLLSLPNENVKQIQFNHDGSRFILLQHLNHVHETKYIVKEYMSLLGTLQSTIESKNYVRLINYTHDTPNNIISIIRKKGPNYCGRYVQELWISNQTPTTLLGSIDLPEELRPALTAIITARENYDAFNPKDQLFDRNTLYVTKKKCAALHLCKQAIKNTHSRTALKNIQHTLPYNSLTDYEKTMVNTNIQKRINEITKAKKDSPKRTNSIQMTAIQTNSTHTLS